MEALKVQCTIQPTITPFLLQEVKDHLRITGTDDDHYIQQLIVSMNEIGAHFTNRALFTSTWKYYLDYIANCKEIYLPRAPLQTISSIKYYDTAGVLTTMDAADYQSDAISEPARVRPAPNTYWPSVQVDRMNCVVIEYIAGYTTRGQLPFAIRNAMLEHISHLYDRREPIIVGTIVATTPFHIMQLYDMERVPWFF